MTIDETHKKLCRDLLEKHGKISSSMVQMKCRVSYQYAKLLIAAVHQEEAMQRFKRRIEENFASCEEKEVMIDRK
jgi:hypothetical protein